MRFVSKYKCRYCGEVINGETTDELTADKTIQQMIIGASNITQLGLLLPRYEVHSAKDYAEYPHLAIADFVGFEVEA